MVLFVAVHVGKAAGGIVVFAEAVHVGQSAIDRFFFTDTIHVIQGAGRFILIGHTVHVGDAIRFLFSHGCIRTSFYAVLCATKYIIIKVYRIRQGTASRF